MKRAILDNVTSDCCEVHTLCHLSVIAGGSKAHTSKVIFYMNSLYIVEQMAEAQLVQLQNCRVMCKA